MVTQIQQEVKSMGRGGAPSAVDSSRVDWASLSPEQSETLKRAWIFADEFGYQSEHGWPYKTAEEWVDMAHVVIAVLRVIRKSSRRFARVSALAQPPRFSILNSPLSIDLSPDGQPPHVVVGPLLFPPLN